MIDFLKDDGDGAGGGRADPWGAPAPPDRSLRPWDQQPGESRGQYAKFCAYRDLGPARNLEDAARAYTPLQKPARPRTRPPKGDDWSKLRTRWRWVERARAYDAHLERERRRAAARKVREDGEQWAARRQHVREDVFRTSQYLMDQARYLSQMPVLRQTKSQDGKVVVWEAIDPRASRMAALVLRMAYDLAMAACDDALESARLGGADPDDPESVRDEIDQATEELAEWQAKMMERASSFANALPMPRSS